MRVLRVFAAIVLVTLVACGGDDGDSDSGAASTSTSTSSTEPTEDESTSTTGSDEADDDGFEVAQLTAGDQHMCALDPDGAAFCWGSNQSGQLGDGTTDDRFVPTPVDTDATFTALAAGRAFTCGITDDARTLCWGANARGQLGDGTTGEGSSDADRSTPAEVDGGLEFTQIVTGQLHACGLTAEGVAHCWGEGASGQLGDGARTARTGPAPVAVDEPIDHLAVGGDGHGCAALADGVVCWGSNAFGQLGNGEKGNAPVADPVEVGGGLDPSTLVLGARHTCALADDGAVSCWGDNRDGQLGDGTTDERFVPTPVDTDLRFESVAAGAAHTCGLTVDGSVHCWGSNGFGQLGDGNDSGESTAPVEVTGPLGFSSVVAGEEFTCAITTEGVAACWGSNRVGWLGTGDDEPSPEPVLVAPPA